MVQSPWLTTHPPLGPIGMAHIVGSWVHLRAQVKSFGSPDFRFHVAWVNGLVGKSCRKTPESKPSQCRGSMVQSTWLTTHPTLGPIGMAHIVGSWVHLRAQVKKIGSPDFRFFVAWVHGLVPRYFIKTPQSKPGQCRGSMVQSTWLTTHPTLGPVGMAHIVGSWVHLRAQVKKIGSPDFRFYVAWVHGLVGNYCRKTPQSKPGQCRGSMVQSTWLTTHPTLGPIGMAHIVGSWVHLRAQAKKLGSPDFRFYVAWVHGLVGNYYKKTPQSKPGQCRGSMVQSTWLTTHPTLGPVGMIHIVGSWVHLRAHVKKIGSPDFRFYVAWVHGLVGNYCRKTPQSKPGQCRGSMVQSTWLTTHPTLGPVGMAHIAGSWVHLRAQVKKIGSPDFRLYVACVHGLLGNYCRKTPQSKPGQCRSSMVQSTWLTTHPTLGPIGMAHIVGSWVHLRAQAKEIGSPDFRFYVAWVHGLVSNYYKKTPQSKPGQCRGSMVQSTWLTTHPTLGPVEMTHIVGSRVHLRAHVKKIGSPDFRFYVAWVHGLVGNYCRKTPQSKPGHCRGSMVQSTWYTTHPTLGPIGMAHIAGSWVHLRAQVKRIGSPDFRLYVACVHGLLGNYCRKTPQSEPGQCRSSMIQSTWLTTHPTLGPIGMAHMVGSWVHLRAQVKNIGSPDFRFYVAWVHGLVGNYCRKTPESKPRQCRGSMVQSTWLTTHPTLGSIGMAHVVGSWVHLRAQVKKIGSPDFQFYVAWVQGLVGNYCRKIPQSKPGQCRGSMVQSTWLTTHPTLGSIGMAHIVVSWVHLRAQVKENGSPDFRFYVAWVHGLLGNYCRKTPQSKPGQCRGSMVQSTWLTTHPTLGPIGMAHIVGSWVHLRAQVKKIGSPDFRFYVAWVHGLVGNDCRKTPQSKPGQCRGSMIQSTWLTTHPTLGPIGKAHIVG